MASINSRIDIKREELIDLLVQNNHGEQVRVNSVPLDSDDEDVLEDDGAVYDYDYSGSEDEYSYSRYSGGGTQE